MVDKDCTIIFDQNEHGTYFTGQTVTGKVTITINKPRKLKGIKLQICGFAACQWRDKRGQAIHELNVKKRKKNVYYGKEDYIATTTQLIGSDSGKNFVMDPGTYTYSFACPIPQNCPSSFEGSFGHVRYLAKVVFSRHGCSNRTHNLGFTILKPLDLNRESNILKAPARNEALENFCFFHNQAVILQVNLVQTGFMPGQYILVNAHVNNESSIDCRRLEILLNLCATYTADTPCMRITTEEMCISRVICAPVRHGTKKDFNEKIRVPPTPPTCQHLSKFVRISYQICVVAVMNQLMCDPKAIIPITIGTVPIAYDESENLSPTTSSLAAAESVESFEEISSVDETEERDELMELPPPTYEEAMFMTTNIADDDVNTVSDAARFTPRYPVFDVDTPPPNKPTKRRRRKKKVSMPNDVQKEKPPRESPVQI